MTLPSHWADQNPLALRAGLDRCIGLAWTRMHDARREYADCLATDCTSAHRGWVLARAERERWALLTLLDIRKGAA